MNNGAHSEIIRKKDTAFRKKLDEMRKALELFNKHPNRKTVKAIREALDYLKADNGNGIQG